MVFCIDYYFSNDTEKEFLTDCRTLFDAIATFTQTIAGWIIQTGKEAAQISNVLSNLVIAGIVYWIIRILICGGCLAVAGILYVVIGIRIANLYKKYCWDTITIMVTLMSFAVTIYFGHWINAVLPVNLPYYSYKRYMLQSDGM